MGASGETEDDSAPKSAVEKPPSTPDMSARDAEDMADAMLLDTPLPDAKRSEEGLPEGDVQASTSHVSSGSVLSQEKLKLAFKLLGVSSRIF